MESAIPVFLNQAPRWSFFEKNEVVLFMHVFVLFFLFDFMVIGLLFGVIAVRIKRKLQKSSLGDLTKLGMYWFLPHAITGSFFKRDTALLRERVCRMKADIVIQNYNQAVEWRNRFLLAALALFVLNAIQAFSVYKLITRQSTIVVPTTFYREFLVGEHKVSDSYLEQMSQYFAALLLNITPSTFGSNIENLLQHTASEHYADFKSSLTQQKQEIEKKGISTSFYISGFKIYRKSLVVKLQGELKIMVANAAMQSKSNTYQIEYVQRHGRLYIKNFKEISKEEFERA